MVDGGQYSPNCFHGEFVNASLMDDLAGSSLHVIQPRLPFLTGYALALAENGNTVTVAEILTGMRLTAKDCL